MRFFAGVLKLVGKTGAIAEVNSAYELKVNQTGTAIDTNNSSTATLLAAAVFTGTGSDVLQMKTISILAKSDQAGSLSIQFSSDNSNWDSARSFTVLAAVAFEQVIYVKARYFRIVYTNGGTDQTYFRLQTLLHSFINGIPVNTYGQLPVTIEDYATAGRGAKVSSNGGLVNMSVIHDKIHSGLYFHCDISVNTPVGGAGEDILIQTGASKMHLFLQVSMPEEICNIVIYEGPTTSGGTAQTIVNTDFSSANVPVLNTGGGIWYNPTVSATGTQKIQLLWPQTRGGIYDFSRKGEDEIIFKASTKYLIRSITPAALGTGEGPNFDIRFYESAF